MVTDKSKELEDKFLLEDKCRRSFPFFCENVLDLELADFHIQQTQELVKSNFRYFDFINPVGHGKSTLFSVAYPVWRLWRETNYEICLSSSSIDQSQKLFYIIQDTLKNNKFFKDIVPGDRKFSWNKSMITTTNRNRYYIKPFNPSARGIHPNLLILDDILREQDTTHEQIKDLVWSIFYPRVQTKKGQLIIVGTPMEEDDLFGELERKSKEKNPQWYSVRNAAVITNEKGEWIRPLWPERFSLKDLEKIRESMGEFRFNREYMCNPLASGGSLFPATHLHNCLEDNLGFEYSTKGTVYIGCDFAMSENVEADYSVFTVVETYNGIYKREIEMNNKQLIVEIENPIIIKKIVKLQKGASKDIQLNSIYSLVSEFNPVRVIVDSTNFGRYYLDDLRAEGIPVDGQDFAPAVRSSMLLKLRRLIEEERLIIPFKQDDSFSYNVTKELVQELNGFRETKTSTGHPTFQSVRKHDDMVMSLVLAVRDIPLHKATSGQVIYSATNLEKNKAVEASKKSGKVIDLMKLGSDKKKKTETKDRIIFS